MRYSKYIAFLLLLPAIALAKVSPSPGGAVKVSGLNAADGLQQGLVLDLPLSKSATIVGADTTAVDFSGYGNDGDVFGAVATADGMTFDGTQWVDTNSAALGLTTSSDMSVSVWVNSSHDYTDHGSIINDYNRDVVNGWALLFQTDDTIRITNIEASSNARYAESNTLLNDGAWHHIVGVLTGDGKEAHLYVDGVLQSNEGIVGSVTQLNLGSGTVKIGVQSNPSERFFVGSNKNIKVYSRALSSASVTALYNSRQKVHSSPDDVLDTVDVNINDPYSRATAYYPLGKNVEVLGANVLSAAQSAMSDSTVWTLTPNAVVVNAAAWPGKMHRLGNSSGNAYITSLITIGQSYYTTFTVSDYVVGSIRVLTGNSSGTAFRSPNGTYTEYTVGSGNTTLYVSPEGAATELSVDDVYVYPVLTADFSSNSNNASIYGATTGPDRFGNPDGAAVFDGVSQYVDCGTSITEFTSSDSFTMLGWVKPGSAAETGYLWGKRDGSGGWSVYINNSSGELTYSVAGGGASRVSDAVFTGTDWMHVAIVVTPSSVEFFKDGVSSGVSAGATFSTPIGVSFLLGNRTGGTTTGTFFDGSIDDTLILPYAASSTTISELANDRSKVHMSSEGRLEATSIVINP